MRLATKRLAKELTELRASGAPAGCALLQADDLQTWLFSISVLGESVYAGETFALRFRFPDAYPMESPECVFVTDGGWKAPVVSRASRGRAVRRDSSRETQGQIGSGQ